jgi:PEP-CTERM motif
MKKTQLILALAASFGASTLAYAKPPGGGPPPPPTPPSCSAATVMTQFTGYQGCVGSTSWNQPGGQFLGYLNTTYPSGATWTWLNADKSDTQGTFGAFQGNPQAPTGQLVFDTPLNGWFAVQLKSSGGTSLYVYNWTGLSVSSLDFDLIGTSVNGNGQTQALSHAELYRGLPGRIPPFNVVPEPSTYLLMASGLAVFGIVARRRRNA